VRKSQYGVMNNIGNKGDNMTVLLF